MFVLHKIIQGRDYSIDINVRGKPLLHKFREELWNTSGDIQDHIQFQAVPFPRIGQCGGTLLLECLNPPVIADIFVIKQQRLVFF